MAEHYGLRANVDQLLAKHRADVDQLQKLTSDFLPKDPMYDEIFLLRFVITHSKKGACDFNEATDAVKKTVVWRTENAEILERTVATGKAPNQDLCMKFNTCGYAGDLGGYEPIFVVRTGHCNSRGLMSTLSMSEVTDWLHFSREIAFRTCDERTRKTRMMIKTISVIDLAGFSVFAGDSRFQKCLAKASELSALYYPQLLGKTVITNMPAVFKAVFRASMALMPASMREKVSVCPQSNTETCGRTVADCPFMRRLDGTLAAVPPFLGGNMPCPDALLPRSELESALTRVTVANRSSTTLDFEVPMAATADWEVVVEDFGINMGAVFLPDLGDPLGVRGAAADYTPQYGPPQAVMEPTKIKAAGGLASGSLALPARGLLRVTFDNSYSVFRSKTFDYRIRVQEGAAPAEAAPPSRGKGEGAEWDFLGLKEETENLLGQLGGTLGVSQN